LPKPFSFIFTWFATIPLLVWLAQLLTSAIIKESLILERQEFLCGTALVYDSTTRLITIPKGSSS
ncbi:hypothetical protein HN51_016430, partial [Arachis hypogaea]